MLWSSYGRLTAALRDPASHVGSGFTRLALAEEGAKDAEPKVIASAQVFVEADGAFTLALDVKGISFELAQGEKTRLWAVKAKRMYECDRSDFAETRRALAECADLLPAPRLAGRLAACVALRPLITGVGRAQGRTCFRLRVSGGSAAVGLDGWPREARFTDPRTRKTWTLTVQREAQAKAYSDRPKRPDGDAAGVPANEMDRSLAAAARILALQWQAAPKEADGLHQEGKGRLEVRDGRRVLYLSGTAREIGYQHGRLLAPNIKRMAERLLYGVGLAYSLEKGLWFLREAEKLAVRQRPYIEPEYIEEMKGLAEGAGLPETIVQSANLFPEFFHCSGAALFGKATKNGELLHARVLDYMTEVGLQDDAVVMAVERAGVRRFVNVGYAGFIGSVTGMNEKQVAIGEMGGGGEGKWDGTPMSFLVRGALENCDTLEEALHYMRSRKRTCEYYYVVSDGKTKSASGIAATPETFETVGPGQTHPRLPDAVEDAVLLSAGDRYKQLVKKVRENYGRIGPEDLMQIIKRPVAMKSNLHDVIFAPQSLKFWVANATRKTPACDEPYTAYSWDELFGSR